MHAQCDPRARAPGYPRRPVLASFIWLLLFMAGLDMEPVMEPVRPHVQPDAGPVPD